MGIRVLQEAPADLPADLQLIGGQGLPHLAKLRTGGQDLLQQAVALHDLPGGGVDEQQDLLLILAELASGKIALPHFTAQVADALLQHMVPLPAILRALHDQGAKPCLPLQRIGGLVFSSGEGRRAGRPPGLLPNAASMGSDGLHRLALTASCRAHQIIPQGGDLLQRVSGQDRRKLSHGRSLPFRSFLVMEKRRSSPSPSRRRRRWSQRLGRTGSSTVSSPRPSISPAGSQSSPLS